MKRAIFALATAICLVSTLICPVIAFATGNNIPITPMYDYTGQVQAVLEINSGTATCMGSVSASNASNKVSIQVILQKKVGTKWSNVDSWSSSGTGSASKKGTKSLTKGYQYKVVVTGQIKNSKGKVLEDVSKESRILSY